ncbi:MAG: helix-turn-helix transcriptional regulator [Oscillibacter sp.]|nr:helix-turn-helix transcriptional regulator [Oscillibacter sp.]
METKIILKDRVRQLRKQAGMKQKELGEILNLSEQAVSSMESGYRSTTIDKLVLLAEYFHVSTDYLVGITDDPAWRGK